MQQRALLVIRLSRVTDATTSPERQLETCRDLCRRRGYAVVGVPLRNQPPRFGAVQGGLHPLRLDPYYCTEAGYEF